MSMYHAPVAPESDAPETLAAEAGEPAFTDTGSERLRDAHLHNGQIEARALFAPYFAVSAVATAGMCGWAMLGAIPIHFIIGWLAVVLFVNWVACRHVMSTAAIGSSRTARPRHVLIPIAEAMGLALVWASLPT